MRVPAYPVMVIVLAPSFASIVTLPEYWSKIASSEEVRNRAEKSPNKPAVTYTPEQIDLAINAISQVADIASIEELKNFYAGAQQAGLLHVDIDGKTLNAFITNRKKELESI